MSAGTQRFVAESDEVLGSLLKRLGVLEALAEGRVFVAGRRADEPNRPVEKGTLVEVYPARNARAGLVILASRRGLVFVDKPPGIATEPERRGTDSLAQRLAAELRLEGARVHALTRLDLGVSGVVVFGVTPEARKYVESLRSRGALRRRYVALATTAPDPERGEWADPIGRRPSEPRRRVDPGGQRALTRYQVAARTPPRNAGASACVLVLEPVTGRTHQLRVHASAHGAPLYGDPSYGGPSRFVLASGEVRALDRVYLHAATLSFDDGTRVSSALPGEFTELWAELGGDAVELREAARI